VIYRMLTGSYPYGKIRAPEEFGKQEYIPVTQHKPELPVELDNTLRRACAVLPQERYRDPGKFSAALATARAAMRANAQQAAAAEKEAGVREHWPIWLAAGLAAGLIAYLYFVLR
jgi:hypothetical protein